MAFSANEILVPEPAPSSFNPDRPLEYNTLLQYQVMYFREVEKQLPPEQQTGIDLDSIRTEGESSAYVGMLTATLREREYQQLIEKKYTVGLNLQDEIALRDLTNELYALDEPFYRPLIDRLKSRVNKSA
jgi:hypothetical protein